MPTSAKIVTRQETTSSVGVDNLNKGSALTATEMDSNLINLKNATVGVLGDNATTIDLASGDTLTITGGTNLSTSASGTTLTINHSGDLTLDGVSITDNKITSNRSNDHLLIEASGTGRIFVGDTLDGETGLWSTAGSNVGSQFHYRDTAYTPSNGSSYPLSRTASYTLSADSGSGNRIRMMDAIDLELDGNSLTSSSNGSGVQIGHLLNISNTNAGTATINKIQGNTSGAFFLGSGGQGTLNASDVIAYRSLHQLSADSGDTINLTNAYGYYVTPTFYAGNGATTTFTNEYGFYFHDQTLRATNTYGVYIGPDSINNRIGGFNFKSNEIKAFTTDDDIKISENGTGEVNIAVESQSTVGAAGGASALPATPSGYIQVKINGVQHVMPYYARS
jgi:hypothetical protein